VVLDLDLDGRKIFDPNRILQNILDSLGSGTPTLIFSKGEIEFIAKYIFCNEAIPKLT
jgi:hypothetical protein